MRAASGDLSSARSFIDGLSLKKGTITFGLDTFGQMEGELIRAPAIQAMDDIT